MRSVGHIRTTYWTPCVLLALGLVACVSPGTDTDPHGNESEVISRVDLTFSAHDGSTPIVASFEDPDGDGGMSGVSDDIVLALDMNYTLDVRLFNSLVDPSVELTDEVREEAQEHFLFVFGDGVSGPASISGSALVTHSYADLESDYSDEGSDEDLPVGLVNTIAANGSGEAELRVMLRHLPELNGTAQKTADLPSELAGGASLPGDADLDVTFNLRVQ